MRFSCRVSHKDRTSKHCRLWPSISEVDVRDEMLILITHHENLMNGNGCISALGLFGRSSWQSGHNIFGLNAARNGPLTHMACFSFNALLLCARPLLLELHMVCLCFLVLTSPQQSQ
jgi:hypothetical protein